MSEKDGLFRPQKPRYDRLEDTLYALAQREMETGDVRPETWEVAQRLSQGNDRRAVAAYIRIRVRALLEAHEARKNESE